MFKICVLFSLLHVLEFRILKLIKLFGQLITSALVKSPGIQKDNVEVFEKEPSQKILSSPVQGFHV